MRNVNWTHLPSLTSLRAFDAVAQTGSFSAAARLLNVTHAAVAQQITSLERHLGLSIVIRSPRGVSLTGTGQKLAESLSTGFGAIADGVQAIAAIEAARPVRVTTTIYFLESVVFPHLATFWQDHPEIEVSFVASDRPFDLVQENFDLGVRAGYGDWPELDAKLLLESPTLACAAPTLVDDPKTKWADVPWLIPPDSEWERDALRKSGIEPAALTLKDVGNPAMEVKAAQQGYGIVVESEIDLRPYLAAGTLKQTPFALTHTSGYYTVVPPWPPRPAVRHFRRWLHGVCRQLA